MDLIKLERFRGVREGEVSELAPLSLLVGPNNSGKSTVLEALYLAQSCHGHAPPQRALNRLVTRRGWIGPTSVRALLRGGPGTTAALRFRVARSGALSVLDLQLETNGQLLAALSGGPRHGLHLNGQQQEEASDALVEVQPPTVPTQQLDEAFSTLELRGHRSTLLELLRPLLPKISDLRILKPDDHYVLHVVDDSGSWPAFAAGDGFKRLLLLAARLATLQGGLALIEEPEAFQHPRSLDQMAGLLVSAVEAGTQVVATTHSLELIDRVLERAEGELGKVVIYRLALDSGLLRAVRVPGEKARELRQEIDEDLRR